MGISPFYVKCLVLLLLLPTIALLPALFWVLPNYLLVRRDTKRLLSEPAVPQHGMSAALAEMSRADRAERLIVRWKRVRDLYITGELIVLFLLHPT